MFGSQAESKLNTFCFPLLASEEVTHLWTKVPSDDSWTHSKSDADAGRWVCLLPIAKLQGNEKYGFFLSKGQTAFTFEANQFLRMCWISSEFHSWNTFLTMPFYWEKQYLGKHGFYLLIKFSMNNSRNPQNKIWALL